MYKITLVLLILALPVSAVGAHDLPTWWLEVAPVLLAIPFIWVFGKQGRISPFLQAFILVHALILMIGGHYTYALTPVGDWVRDLGMGERNNYDKLGHLFQGIMPALLIREVFMRLGYWNKHPVFLGAMTVLAAGGVSALYEVLEMTAALILGGGADAFLGTQGYVWDTQTDMATALAGALLAVFLLPRMHARSIR
jgi:putative membrane protein